MPWPPEATSAMNSVFSFMSIVPKLATVEFATSCFGETLGAKLVAPAIYYLANPVAAMLGVFLMCALAVYLLIPLAGKMGVFFNPLAQRRQAKSKAVAQFRAKLEPYLPPELKWEDLMEGRGLSRLKLLKDMLLGCFWMLLAVLGDRGDMGLQAIILLEMLHAQEVGLMEESSLEVIEDGLNDPEGYVLGATAYEFAFNSAPRPRDALPAPGDQDLLGAHEAGALPGEHQPPGVPHLG